MARLRTSRIIPVALVLIIIVIAIAAMVSLARVVFFSGSQTPAVVDTSRSALLSTTIDRSVKMTVRGAIVADEAFHSYQILITPTTRTLTTYNGYLDSTVSNVTLGNNVPAYTQFVYALDKANLAKGTAFTGDNDDTRGVCATGLLYEFAIIQNTSVVKHLWTSTCGGSKGSLDASVAQLTNLFVAQIPNAHSYISKIAL